MAQLAGASDCSEEYGASCVEGSSAGASRPRASSGSLYSSCVRCAMLVGPLQGVLFINNCTHAFEHVHADIWVILWLGLELLVLWCLCLLYASYAMSLQADTDWHGLHDLIQLLVHF